MSVNVLVCHKKHSHTRWSYSDWVARKSGKYYRRTLPHVLNSIRALQHEQGHNALIHMTDGSVSTTPVAFGIGIVYWYQVSA